MKKSLVFLFVILIVFVGCKNEKNNVQNKIGQKEAKQNVFVPPKDGKITKEQADRYINLAIKMENFVFDRKSSIDSFCKANNIAKDDIAQITDTLFAKKHPKLLIEWVKFNKHMEDNMQTLYKECNMSEKEFEWVAGSLIDEKNRKMQEYVAAEIDKRRKNEKK